MAKKSLEEKLDELIALLEVETNPVKRAFASAKLEGLLARTEKELEIRKELESIQTDIDEAKAEMLSQESMDISRRLGILSRKLKEKEEFLSDSQEYNPYSEEFIYRDQLQAVEDYSQIIEILKQGGPLEKSEADKISEYMRVEQESKNLLAQFAQLRYKLNEKKNAIKDNEFRLTVTDYKGKIGKFFSGIIGFFKGFCNSIRGHKSMMQKEKDGFAKVDEISSIKYSEEYEKRLDEVSQLHQDEISYVNEKSRERDQAYTKDIADIDAEIAELTKQIEAKRMNKQRLEQEQQKSSHSAERILDKIRTNISTEVAKKMGGTEEEYIASQQDEFRRRTRVSQDVRDRVNNVTSQMQLHVQDNDGQEQTSSDGQEPGDD